MANRIFPSEGQWNCIETKSHAYGPKHNQISEKWSLNSEASVLLLQDNRIDETSFCLSIRTGLAHETFPGISVLTQNLILKKSSLPITSGQQSLENLIQKAQGMILSRVLLDQTLFAFSWKESEHNPLNFISKLFQEAEPATEMIIPRHDFLRDRVHQQGNTFAQELFKVTLEAALPVLSPYLLAENLPYPQLPASQVEEWIEAFYYTSPVTACFITNQPLDQVRDTILKTVGLLKRKPVEVREPLQIKENLEASQIVYVQDAAPFIRITWPLPGTHKPFQQNPELISIHLLLRKHAHSLQSVLSEHGLVKTIQIEEQNFSPHATRFFHLDLVPTQKGILRWQEVVQTCVETVQALHKAPEFPKLYEQWINSYNVKKDKSFYIADPLEQSMEWAAALQTESLETFPQICTIPLFTCKELSESLSDLFSSPYIVTLACPLETWNVFRVQNNLQPMEEAELCYSSLQVPYKKESLPSFSTSSLPKVTHPLPTFLPSLEDQQTRGPFTLESFVPPIKKGNEAIWYADELFPHPKGKAVLMFRLRPIFPSQDLSDYACSILANAVLDGRLETLAQEIESSGGEVQYAQKGLADRTFTFSYWKSDWPKLLDLLKSQFTGSLSEKDKWLFQEKKNNLVEGIRRSLYLNPLCLILEKLHQVTACFYHDKKSFVEACQLCDWDKLLHKEPGSFCGLGEVTLLGFTEETRHLFESQIFSLLPYKSPTVSDPYRQTYTCITEHPLEAAALAIDCGASYDPFAKGHAALVLRLLEMFIQEGLNEGIHQTYCLEGDIGGRIFLILAQESEALSSETILDRLLVFSQEIGLLMPEFIGGTNLSYLRQQIPLYKRTDQNTPLSLCLLDFQNERRHDWSFWDKRQKHIEQATNDSLIHFFSSAFDFGKKRFITVTVKKRS
ncbi:hypothetical protein HAT2_00614 [Candidatus Similichlamydia laticola]|uniref:Peptidase M16 C-terminal domain-containing protein n=2 Tax=Candidatus Similichlamydia laticola TaxID=2170265 RepID=A0A369KJW5_9BACT|nr:hypothetical protein HAT2_00614 [Candidatus Similichlamydia laticola]